MKGFLASKHILKLCLTHLNINIQSTQQKYLKMPPITYKQLNTVSKRINIGTHPQTQTQLQRLFPIT